MHEGRSRRLLGRGDFRLIVLELIARAPKHGYSVIEEIERMADGAYAPSPGIVYPALLFLEEGGFLASTAENNRKIYRITERGTGVLAENRERIDLILDRLSHLGRCAGDERRTVGRSSRCSTEAAKAGGAQSGSAPRDFVTVALTSLEATVSLARGRLPETVLVDKLKDVERVIAQAAMGVGRGP